jgi:ABC-2 type transport system permease protein
MSSQQSSQQSSILDQTSSFRNKEAFSVPAIPVIATLAQRELVRFFRQRNRVMGALGQPVLFWWLFSAGLQPSGLGYAHFFPGILAMILLFTAIFTTISIIEDRREGFLQSVLVSPAPQWAMVLGKILGGAAIAMLQGLLFLLLGGMTLGLTSSLGDLVMAILMMGLLSVSLTGLGFLIAWRMNSTQGFHAIMSLFLFPMWLLSGAFFPQGGQGLLAWVVAVNPLTYGVAGLRHYLQFGDTQTALVQETLSQGSLSQGPSMFLCWMVSIGFALAMLALSWRISGTRTTGDLL